MKRHLLLFALLLLISGAMFGQEYTISFLSNNDDWGSVNPTRVENVPSGTAIISNGNVLTISIDGAPVTVTATPAEATAQYTYAFVNWSGIPEQVTGDVTITANFNRTDNTFTVTVVPNNGDYGSVNPTSVSDVPFGTVITQNGNTLDINGTTVTATPAEATAQYTYAFVNWNGIPEQVTEDVTITANFTQMSDTYTVTVVPNNGEYGSVTPASVSEVPYGTVITQNGNTLDINGTTVTATPAEATAQYTYAFVNWNGIPEQVTGDVTITANFNRTDNTFTVTVVPNNGDYGSVNPTSVSDVPFGTVITQNGNTLNINGTTVTATPAVATSQYTYAFGNWSGIPDEVTGNITITANFTRTVNSYTISVSANPSNGGGSVYVGDTPGSLQQDFNYGDPCTVHATPNNANGFIFENWTENGEVVSTQAEYRFEVQKERHLVAHFAQQHTVTVLALPEEGGNPYIGNTFGTTQATFTHGQSCTVHANLANGYSFQQWTVNGNQVSTNANFTFTVNDDCTLVANYTPLPFTISVSAEPSNGGTVTGGGGYHYGENCTLRATPLNGFAFENWTEGDDIVSTYAEYQFTVTCSRTLVAHFTALPPDTYSINVSANPNNGGSPYIGNTPGTTQANFTHGQSCTVHANPANGYIFVNWTENGNQVSTNANYTFTVNDNHNLVANFQAQTYTISVSAQPTNGGAPYIGSNHSTTQATFTHGHSCTVHANPANGYEFVNWKENNQVVQGAGANYTFTVTSNRTLVAHFTAQAPNTYTITATADPANGGSVTGGGTYEQDATCTLTATPNTGYDFVNWKKGEEVVSTNSTHQFQVTESAAYVAHFRLKSFTINVSADPSNGGTVSGGGTYDFGQSCTLSATPNSNYVFDKWTKNGTQVSDNPTYTFTVTGDASYVAHFKKKACTIKVSANPTNGGTVYIGNTPGTTQATYNYGETCTVHARANSGFTFINWTENDQQVSSSPDYTFNVTGDHNLVANFADASACIIYVDIEPEIGGTVTGAGEYSPGDVCTLKAFAKVGYEFKNWTINDVEVSTELSYTFTVTGTEYYVAHFEEKKYTITATSNNEDWGTVTGGGNYNYGGNCTLKATAKSGCTFSHWMKDDNTIIIENPYTFVVWDAASFTAIFELESTQQYTITATANPEEGGTVTGGGTYASGVTCKLKATPNTGYTFINWTENGTAVSSNATYTFTVSIDRNLIANFEKDEVPCIENDKIQKIVPKDHTEDNETYTLILVYPNPDEEYVYQWRYAPETDSLHYRDLNVNDGTYNKQYFYRGGALLKGYYKVRISKEKGGCSPVETEPYHVTYKHATQLRIYPNPSRRDHNIVVVNDSDGPSQLSIYSTDGRLLHAQTVTDNQTTLNLNLPSGVYIAYLTDSDGYTKIGKLVIQ